MRASGALYSDKLATITSCEVSKRPHVKNKNQQQQQNTGGETFKDDT